MSSADAIPEDSLDHRPFRAWALQHDLISLLGGGGDWRSVGDDLGLEGPSSARPEESLRGQAQLRRVLATDPRFELRTRTSMALWGAALATDIANQLSPFGLRMETVSFWVTISLVTLALSFTALVYPRLSPARFPRVEQTAMCFASLLIVFQCSKTGNADSPYLIWFILTAYYVSYLMPSGQALVNLAWFSLLATATLLFTSGADDSLVILQLATLLVTMWVLGIALINQRRREVTLQRAETFFALADPLTSAANTRAFEQHLRDLVRHDGQRFALVIADMNGLKGANAVFGHEVGDGMVARLARLMFLASDDESQVARLGGDEFAVVIPGGGEAEIKLWRDRFQSTVERHNAAVRGRLPQISTALGAAVYPDDGVTPAALIDSADRRMYAEKSTVVTPPHEIEGLSSSDGGRAFHSARLQAAPRRAVDQRERMYFGAANWLACGSMALAVAAIGGPYVHGAGAVACGAFALFWAAFSGHYGREEPSRRVNVSLDVATLLYALPLVWASGGASSPVLILISLPVAFYAQNFRAGIALPRVAILIVGYSLGFWAFGAHGDQEITRYFTTLAAMLVVTGIMLYSSGQQRASLGVLRRAGTIDALTGLPNVFALRRDLDSAVAEGPAAIAPPGLVLVDIDGFRRVNTLAGHRGGDDVICSVAERLTYAAGDAQVYRVEGDEFAVLAETRTERELPDFARELAVAVEHEQLLGGALIHVTASSGHAIARSGDSGDDLVDTAETALRAQKAARGRTDARPGRVLL